MINRISEAGSSDDRCSEIYQGEAAFSEKESRFEEIHESTFRKAIQFTQTPK